MVISASSACALHKYVTGTWMWATKTWTGRDLQSHKEEQDTGCAPPPHSQGIQKVHSSLRWRPWQCTGESPSWALGHQPCGLKKHGSGDQRPKFESQICYLAALGRCTSYLLLSALASSSEKWRRNCLPLRTAVKIRDDVYQVPSQHLYEKGAQ